MSDQPQLASDAVTDMITHLEAHGYVVGRAAEQSPSDVLLARMEMLAGDLQVIDGVTKRGGVLPFGYRAGQLQSLQQYAERVFDALRHGVAVRNDWDR